MDVVKWYEDKIANATNQRDKRNYTEMLKMWKRKYNLENTNPLAKYFIEP
ncbi:hypothetical protein ACT0LX_003387 [Vibrio parahaemolyticus]|nr:hypothetical protein [Vibrio parahaemolyticus]